MAGVLRDLIGPRLERRVDGQIWAVHDGQARAVRVTRCFPWSAPSRLISLRDERRREFLLIQDPAQLDEASRRLLEEALVEADFVFDIERIEAVEEEVEIRNWRVVTRQGIRRFQTKRDEWPRQLPGGGLLIRDVAGDLFCVRDPARLDRGSRERLWVFID